MLLKKLNFYSKKLYFSILDKVANLGLSFNYLFFIILSAFAILFLSYNIYKTVKRAETNFSVREQEREKRDELKAELEEVEEKIAYLNSQDAKRNLAVDGYKMAAPDEDLYEIKEGEIEAVYINEEELEPINLEDNRFWWELLVFGEDGWI